MTLPEEGLVTSPEPAERCTATGESAGFWLIPKPGDTDLQKGGLFLFSILRGMGQAMRGEPRAGTSCDVHPDSILAIAARSRGFAAGPVVYVPHTCPARAPSACIIAGPARC